MIFRHGERLTLNAGESTFEYAPVDSLPMWPLDCRNRCTVCGLPTYGEGALCSLASPRKQLTKGEDYR